MNLFDEATRRRAVTVALRLAAGTALEPDAYERDLLEAYVQGQVSLEHMEHLLEKRALSQQGEVSKLERCHS